MSALSMLRGLPAAVIFLTRIPVPGTYADEDFRNASAFFPLVGFAIGGASALAFALSRPFGVSIAACLSVGVATFMTGALHEDGLADSADALFGGASRERVLTILKDPRLGSFGVISLVMVVVTRIACVSTLSARAGLGFLLAHSISRFAATATMASLPYVRDDETSKSRSLTGAGAMHVGIASLAPLVLVVILLLGGVVSIGQLSVILVAAAATAFFLGHWFRRRIGGIVGDFLGATVQVVDLSVWLALAAVSS